MELGIHNTMASFRILGIGLDFRGISEQLGIQPSLTRRKGEHGLIQTPQSADVWCLDSPLPRSEPLEVHLKSLRQVLLPHCEFLRSLRGKCDLSIYCGITTDGDRCQFHLSSDSLRMFAELGIDMDLSLVFTGYSNSEPLSSETANVNDKLNSEGAEASFHIIGAALDESWISNALGIASSKTNGRGYASVYGNPPPTNSWSLVAAVPRSSDLDKHLRWLGATLLPSAGFLLALKEKGTMLVLCDFVTRSDTGGVVISAEGLRICTELDIPLDFKAFLIWQELAQASELV